MSADKTAPPPMMQLWTREGFLGPMSVFARSSYAPDYVSVEGPHAPRRCVVERLTPPDADDDEALPMLVADSRQEVQLLISARKSMMPFLVRNTEADELHFIQHGQVRFDTEVGSFVAGEGDFVCIPRSVAYRYGPLGGAMRSMILASPPALSLTPPAPFGMINFARDVHYPKLDPELANGGPTRLVLKSFDGVSRYVMAHSPLALNAQVSGAVPVWKINLKDIQVLTYLPHGGPPAPFLSSPGNEVLAFNLSARTTRRPPIHVNADFDEIVFYVGGPGAWGGCTEPGTLTWVPKGVIHHGPSEDVPEGYSAWLIETRATFRFTPEALAGSELMETGEYGPHPTAGA